MVTMNALDEKLYLEKGEKEVIIKNYRELSKQQINAIRCLHSQCINEKPGVILNNQHGSSLVRVLVKYLNAVKQYISTYPVLIISSSEDLEAWSQFLKKYSSYTDDEIIIEEINPCKKKLLYLNSLESGLNLCNARKWSIIIIDSNNISKNIVQVKMDTSFRVWITTLDLKKNLPTFSILYNWLYPKETFVIEDFQADEQNIRDVVNKAIMWESFIRDIVIRSSDNESKLLEEVVTVSKPTKKNKDASGKKIKRTKRKIEDDEDLDCDVVNKSVPKRAILETPDSQIHLHYDESEEIKEDVTDEIFMQKSEANNEINEISININENDKIDENMNCHREIFRECDTEMVEDNNILSNYEISQNKDSTVERENDTGNGVNIELHYDKDVTENIETGSNDNTVVAKSFYVKKEKDIEEQIADIEKEVMEKYKGSILDNMFNF